MFFYHKKKILKSTHTSYKNLTVLVGSDGPLDDGRSRLAHEAPAPEHLQQLEHPDRLGDVRQLARDLQPPRHALLAAGPGLVAQQPVVMATRGGPARLVARVARTAAAPAQVHHARLFCWKFC